MGQRGPKPLPTKVLEMRGSWLAKVRAPHEPRVPGEIPPRPAYLTPEEQKVWRVLTRRLHQAGLVARIDGEMLARYCILRGQWLRALSFLREHGEWEITQAADGRKIFSLYPQVHQIETLHHALLRVEREFGMSPSARASLGALNAAGHPNAESEADNKKERFFQRRA